MSLVCWMSLPSAVCWALCAVRCVGVVLWYVLYDVRCAVCCVPCALCSVPCAVSCVGEVLCGFFWMCFVSCCLVLSCAVLSVVL